MSENGLKLRDSPVFIAALERRPEGKKYPLCTGCSAFNWKSNDWQRCLLVSQNRLLGGTLFQLLTRSWCQICRLILHLLSPLSVESSISWALDQPLTASYDISYVIRVVKGSELGIVRYGVPPGFFFPVDFFQRLKRPFSVRRLLGLNPSTSNCVKSNDLNVDKLHSYLKQCDDLHSYCRTMRCKAKNDTHIRLVDVTEQKIIAATTRDTYLALSYVWGGIDQLTATKSNIAQLEKPEGLREQSAYIPQTIQDAMILVARLGHRFLWVDALCIVQDDAINKHDQISNMHSIYTSAYATIVQRSGSNAAAGLSGVRLRSRSKFREKAPVGKYDMVALPVSRWPGTGHYAESSVHDFRAWTLQETLLSHRCIHICEKVTTFSCGEQYLHEVEEPAFYDPRYERAQWMINVLRNPEFIAMENEDHANTMGLTYFGTSKEWQCSFGIYARVLISYTSRQLSFQEDIFDAFRGLGDAIAWLSDTRLYYGLPSVSFDLALLWTVAYSEGDDDGQVRRIVIERTIPTWSWASRMGTIIHLFGYFAGGTITDLRTNAFFKTFYIVQSGNSQVIKRESCPAHIQSSLHQTREARPEPEATISLGSTLPDGCLYFWAEVASLDQFSLENIYSYRHDRHYQQHKVFCVGIALAAGMPTSSSRDDGSSDGEDKPLCGAVALTYTSIINRDVSSQNLANCFLVLISENEKSLFLGNWGFQYHKDWFSDFYFDVLLVKQVGDFVERLACEQVSMKAWMEVVRDDRYIFMI